MINTAPPPLVIHVDMSPEAYTHKFRRIVILTQHSYALDISDDGKNWHHREIITLTRKLPEQIKPGQYKILK